MWALHPMHKLAHGLCSSTSPGHLSEGTGRLISESISRTHFLDLEDCSLQPSCTHASHSPQGAQTVLVFMTGQLITHNVAHEYVGGVCGVLVEQDISSWYSRGTREMDEPVWKIVNTLLLITQGELIKVQIQGIVIGANINLSLFRRIRVLSVLVQHDSCIITWENLEASQEMSKNSNTLSTLCSLPMSICSHLSPVSRSDSHTELMSLKALPGTKELQVKKEIEFLLGCCIYCASHIFALCGKYV